MDSIPFGEGRIPVVSENDDFIAVDKPFGLASIPGTQPEERFAAQGPERVRATRSCTWSTAWTSR